MTNSRCNLTDGATWPFGLTSVRVEDGIRTSSELEHFGVDLGFIARRLRSHVLPGERCRPDPSLQQSFILWDDCRLETCMLVSCSCVCSA